MSVEMLRILEYEGLPEKERSLLLERMSSAEETDVRSVVTEIVDRVFSEGIAAALEYVQKFDGATLNEPLAGPQEFEKAEQSLGAEEKQAFNAAAANIRAFHELQRPDAFVREALIAGSRLGYKLLPVEGAGVYAPGGTALYPSSVLMGLIPAAIAGVKEPILITPSQKDGSLHPAILYCARLAGAGVVLKIGGAQGIALAATGLVCPPSRLIIGPGNRYVTQAKTLLADRGIIRMDMPAGPSEVVIIADKTADARYVAADLLSQAEHGSDSSVILLTDSKSLALATVAEINRGIEQRPHRREMKEASIRNHSYALVFSDIADAFSFSNEYAPEHLEICTADPESDFSHITNAGSVFLGHYAPVALGDYYSGTNHVLPTNGAARFYSGLGVDAFLKRITYQFPTRDSLHESLDPIMRMSRLEGFDQEHGHSIAVRFKDT